jgi:hypothetical protein
MRVFIGVLLSSFIGGLTPVSSLSAESAVNEVGVRMGIQDGSRPGHFRSFEAFAARKLPWDLRASSGWGVAPQVTASLGLIEGAGNQGVSGSAGIAFVLDKNGPGVSTEIGLSTNLLNRRRFGSMDFGSALQFVSHIGLSYRFDNGLKIGYRWQHMSNGGIFYSKKNPNPGLDMHLMGISYVF